MNGGFYGNSIIIRFIRSYQKIIWLMVTSFESIYWGINTLTDSFVALTQNAWIE